MRERISSRFDTDRSLDLALPDPPIAIFAFNDNIVIGAVQAADARGLRVPDDLSMSASTTSSTRPS